MSIKEYLLRFCFVLFLMLIIFPVVMYIITVIVNLFINPRWDFFKDIIIWPIFGTLMWIAQLFESIYIFSIIFFSMIFIFITYYLKKTRKLFFLIIFLFLIYAILYGKSIYYFLLNQNNTIHSEQLIINIITIFIASFIFNNLLRKYLWK